MKAMMQMENAVMAYTHCDRLAANLAVNAVLSINNKIEQERNETGSFAERYLQAERNLRKHCDEMVERGEMSEDEADFRYYIVRDEILEDMSEDEH